MTESLTTDLSRISGSFVIGRNTAFAFRGKHVDLEIGRELNVRYVLEGCVQRGAGRMRVSVQLIDAESGNHLWAERFDKPLADLFDMQDEIVARLANRLERTGRPKRSAPERAPNPDSMDLLFQGRSWWNKGITPQTLRPRATCMSVPWRSIPPTSELCLALRVDFAVGGAFPLDDRDRAARRG